MSIRQVSLRCGTAPVGILVCPAAAAVALLVLLQLTDAAAVRRFAD